MFFDFLQFAQEGESPFQMDAASMFLKSEEEMVQELQQRQFMTYVQKALLGHVRWIAGTGIRRPWRSPKVDILNPMR